MNSGPSFGIVSFKIEGFRGIKDASVEGIPADTKWIFLTGKNGGGKTSVLQALFVGLLGKRDGNTILEGGSFEIEILVDEKDGHNVVFYHSGEENSENGEDDDRHIFPSNSKHFFQWKINPSIVAYGAIRTQISNNSTSEDFLKSDSLFKGKELLNIESTLKNWTLRSASTEVRSRDLELAKILEVRVLKLKELLLKLMPNIQEVRVDVVEDKVFYYEKDDTGNGLHEPKNFEQLASGNRSIIAMIGDMLMRLYAKQPEVGDPLNLEGLVLIDELDVHLHPSWQKALPGLLSEIFPKIQFIASTHSPIPLLGAPKESVVLKVHQSSEAGITVEKLDIDVSQLLPNSLLTSPIFDFEDIIPTANTSLEDLHTEDNFEEAMANEAIKERLKKIAQTL